MNINSEDTEILVRESTGSRLHFWAITSCWDRGRLRDIKFWGVVGSSSCTRNPTHVTSWRNYRKNIREKLRDGYQHPSQEQLKQILTQIERQQVWEALTKEHAS